MLEDLAVREEWKKKNRWRSEEKIEGFLHPDQSTWAFDPAATATSDLTKLEPPWLQLHAASFLVQGSQRKVRSRVAVVIFRRSELPADLVSNDRGEHIVTSLESWHRTLRANDPESRADLARAIAAVVRFERFTRNELAPLLQELLNHGFVQEKFCAIAEELVRLAE